MQKTPILILLAILSLLFTNPVIAEDAVIYDSGELAITSWHVHLSKHTFEASHPENVYLNIKKNTPGLDIQAGFLILNFRLIPLTRFLTGPDSTFKKEIKLRQTNRLRVILIGSLGASITITVHDEEENQPPAVNFSAEPETIVAGSTSTLSWSSEHADSCAIEPGIGAVDTVGSITFSPAATTTYTITAIGSGGTVSSSVTVTVNIPAPTITLSADPLQIVQGGSSTLAWSTVNADAVSIDQGIGEVDASGSHIVSPTETTTYMITATGFSGEIVTASVTVTVYPLILSITSPAHMQHISRHDVLVEGTVSNTNGTETGVVVNDVPAMVFDGQFVANHIPLVEGENTITVKATDANGNSIEETITVFAEIAEGYISLSADAESGVAPLETMLRVNGPFNFLTPSITFTGPDGVNFLASTEENTYPVRMSQAGIYRFTAEVTDDQSKVFSDTVAIVVMSAEDLDLLLKAKWAEMKTALSAGNIEKALHYHHIRGHEKYTAIYSALGDDLPALVSQMQEISQICYSDGVAKYRIRQDHDINGQVVTITYYIYFSRGENGLWLIEKY